MKLISIIFCTMFLVACGSRAMAVSDSSSVKDRGRELPVRGIDGQEYSPTTLIVMCDSTIGKEPLRTALKEIGATVIYDYNIIYGMAIRKPDDMTLEETMAILKQVDGVVSVSKDRITRLTDPVKPRLYDR
ncbi:MAG: hypothetical protein J6S96_07280 [Muribaculaceae bacterium]|nr:hypothetical protein [Muribaculaceae bacterium]